MDQEVCYHIKHVKVKRLNNNYIYTVYLYICHLPPGSVLPPVRGVAPNKDYTVSGTDPGCSIVQLLRHEGSLWLPGGV